VTGRGLPRLFVCALAALAGSTACAPKRLALPAGAGTPFPAFAAAYGEATSQCRGARTITATLALSGRAGDTRLRGNVDAGFAEPASVRLEGRAPFGRPLFILVARDAGTATLVLPRDNRVLRGAPPASIVEALAGIALGPADLRSVVAGCGLGAADPSAGRAYEDNWVAVDAGETTTFLRQADGAWRLVAARRAALSIEYDEFTAGRPTRIRMRAAAGPGPPTDVAVRLSDVDINVPLGDEVFAVDVSPQAEPLTLDELRRAGPLGGASGQPGPGARR
jgi:hypothetical protein